MFNVIPREKIGCKKMQIAAKTEKAGDQEWTTHLSI